MTLADFTSAELVVPRLHGPDVAAVIQELSQALSLAGRLTDSVAFCQAVLARETLFSTGTEEGMAFPHARLAGLTKLSFAFGRADPPVPWGTRGSRAVRLVFLIAVPEKDVTQHLLLISGLAHLSREDELVKKLYGARDTLQILDVLGQIRLRNAAPLETAKAVVTQTDLPPG